MNNEFPAFRAGVILSTIMWFIVGVVWIGPTIVERNNEYWHKLLIEKDMGRYNGFTNKFELIEMAPAPAPVYTVE